jgi:hypothetical protein
MPDEMRKAIVIDTLDPTQLKLKSKNGSKQARLQIA